MQPTDAADPPIRSGSIGIWTYETATRLAGSFEVAVYASPRRRLRTRSFRHRGVEFVYPSFPPAAFLERAVRFLRRLRCGEGGAGKGSRLPVFASTWTYLGYSMAVALELKRRGADVVHIHNWSQIVPAVRHFNPGVKIVLHMHCEWLSQLPRRKTEKRLAVCDLVAGCSPYVTKKIREAYPASADRCVTVPNGTDIPQAAVPLRPSGSKVLFVGRLSPEKGVHDLLNAFGIVVGKHPGASLELVGGEGVVPREFLLDLSDEREVKALSRFYDGTSYKARLEKLIARNMREAVTFTGPLPYDSVREKYAGSDVLVNPSLSEAFGMSVLEAMAAGLPVVVTRVGGMTDLVRDGETGLVVPPADPEALAAALVRVLSDSDLRAALGRAARRYAERFSWDKVAAGLEGTYRRLVSTFPGPEENRRREIVAQRLEAEK